MTAIKKCTEVPNGANAFVCCVSKVKSSTRMHSCLLNIIVYANLCIVFYISQFLTTSASVVQESGHLIYSVLCRL